MDADLTRLLMIADVRVLCDKIVEIDAGYNLVAARLTENVLLDLPMESLTTLRRDMRDLLRSLGGARS